MNKRLSKQEKKEKSVIDLVNMMFEIAGHTVTFEDIKDRKDNWFHQWTMTTEQNDQWKLWGKKYLIKNLRMNAKMAEKEMMWVSLQWGLKFSDLTYNIIKNEQD
jgi:transcription initiation factor IIE alpha subunit